MSSVRPVAACAAAGPIAERPDARAQVQQRLAALHAGSARPPSPAPHSEQSAVDNTAKPTRATPQKSSACRKFAIIALVFAAAWACSGYVKGVRKTVDRLERANSELRREVSALHAEVSGLRDAVADVRLEVSQLRDRAEPRCTAPQRDGDAPDHLRSPRGRSVPSVWFRSDDDRSGFINFAAWVLLWNCCAAAPRVHLRTMAPLQLVTISCLCVCRDRDILFHFNPRSSEGVIVMNAQHNGQWGSEERIPLPRPSEESLLSGRVKHRKEHRHDDSVRGSIFVKDEGFLVVLDGGSRYLFKHRLPLASFTQVKSSSDWVVTEYGDRS
jgi:hypothetical protein